MSEIVQTQYIYRYFLAIMADKTGRWELLQLHNQKKAMPMSQKNNTFTRG